jgi:hypothetical protein
MSVLNVNKIADASGGVLAPISSVMRNRIINGQMTIDQRNAGASVTANDGVFPVDRFKFSMTQSSKGTGQQNAGSVTPPTGFANYLGFTSSSAYSVVAADQFAITQNIEGFNFADLGWGTANAKTVTLSFWVRSSLTGTFGGSLQNSAANRSYPFTYTINSANTWEYETITVAGDTSGTWIGATNGIGLRLFLSLGMGSTSSGTAGAWAGANYQSATGATSVVGTNGATFYITGVQLEVGTQATGFEYRQYGQELALCQRYAIWLPFGARTYTSASASYGGTCPYAMRTAPTFASPVADPTAASAISSNVAAGYGFLASYSGTSGGYFQISSSGTGDSYVFGYRALATAEL